MTTEYDQQIAIVQGVRQALPKFSHYQNISARIKPHLEAALPGYTTYIHVEKHSWGTDFSIKIWGNGLPHDKAVNIWWSDRKGTKWQDLIQEAIDRADPTDSKQREQQEAFLIPILSELDHIVEDTIRYARALVANLPVPMAATVRADPKLWQSASSKLHGRFPRLFDGYMDDDKPTPSAQDIKQLVSRLTDKR